MDEELSSADQSIGQFGQMAKKIGNTMAKALKILIKLIWESLKLVGMFLKWLITIMASNIYVLIFVLIIVAVIVVALAVFYLIMGAGFDKNNGTMSSIGGVTGDLFYGQRYMYFDETYSTADLSNVYLEFTYNIMDNIKATASFSINLTNQYSENVEVKNIATYFSQKLANTTNGTLQDNASLIDHYGFTTAEKDIVLDSMAEYIANNGMSTNTKAVVLSELKKSYDAEFAYMKNVCKKIVIKDYILEPGKTVENIEKKNYFAFIYMPKESVVLNEASFVFAVDEDKTVNININHTNGNNTATLEVATADDTWFKNGICEKAIETKETKNITLNQFTAIDTNNLEYFKDGKTLFQVLRDGKFSTYFKDTEGDYSEEMLVKNINTQNYLYLQLYADSAFNMAEGIVEAERA